VQAKVRQVDSKTICSNMAHVTIEYSTKDDREPLNPCRMFHHSKVDLSSIFFHRIDVNHDEYESYRFNQTDRYCSYDNEKKQT
jgi:hypothetical protein